MAIFAERGLEPAPGLLYRASCAACFHASGKIPDEKNDFEGYQDVVRTKMIHKDACLYQESGDIEDRESNASSTRQNEMKWTNKIITILSKNSWMDG